MRAGHTPARLAPAGRPRPPGPCGSISAPRPGQTVLSCHFPSPNSAAACQIPSLFPNSFLTGLPRPLAGLAASTLEGLPVLVHSSASLTPLPGYAPGLVFGLGSSIPTLRLAPPGLSLPRAERTRRPGLTHTSPGTPQLPASVHPHTLRLPGAPSLPLPLDASHRHRPFLPSVPCGASAPSPLPAPGPREPRPSPLRASGTSVSPSSSPLRCSASLGNPSARAPLPLPSRCTLRAPALPPFPPPRRPPLPQPGPASRSPGARLLPPSQPPYPTRRPLGTGGAGRGPGRPGLPLASAGGGGTETSGSSGPAAPGTRARGARARGREGRRRLWKRAPCGNTHAATRVPRSRSWGARKVRVPAGLGCGRRAPASAAQRQPCPRPRRGLFGCRDTRELIHRLGCLCSLDATLGRGVPRFVHFWPGRPACSPAQPCKGRVLSVGRGAPRGVDADPSPRKARQCWLLWRWGRAPPRVPLMGKLRPEAARGRVLEVPGTDRGAHGDTEAVLRFRLVACPPTGRACSFVPGGGGGGGGRWLQRRRGRAGSRAWGAGSLSRSHRGNSPTAGSGVAGSAQRRERKCVTGAGSLGTREK